MDMVGSPPDDVGMQKLPVVDNFPFSVLAEPFANLHRQHSDAEHAEHASCIELLSDGGLTTRAMYLTATSSFDLMCFMSLISPFRPAPSSPTCGDISSAHSQSLTSLQADH